MCGMHDMAPCTHQSVTLHLFSDTWEWNYAGESADGEEITPRNSHSLHVITVPSSAKTHPEGTVKDAGIEHDSKEVGAEASSYLVLFGGSSPERGPMSDTYYAALPSGGITSEFINDT